MPIDSVIQDFLADVAGYVDGLGEAIAMAEEFAQANKDALGSVAALQAGIDALHGKDIEINVDTGGLGAIAQMDTLIASVDGVRDSLDALAADSAADSAVVVASLGRVNDALDGMATRAVADSAVTLAALDSINSSLGNLSDNSGRATIAGWGLWGAWNAIAGMAKTPLFGGMLSDLGLPTWIAAVGGVHLLIDGVAELAAVVIPAAIAFGAFAAVAEPSVDAIYKQMTNLSTVALATRQNLYPMTGLFEQLAGAVQPEVYQLFGQGLALASQKGAEFSQMATGAGQALDVLGARIEVALAGGGLDSFLTNAVSDLAKLGDIAGNVMGTLGNLFHAFPGYAQDLLGVADAGTRLTEWASGFAEPLIAAGLAVHGALLYMGLAATAASSAVRGGLTMIGNWAEKASMAAADSDLLGGALSRAAPAMMGFSAGAAEAAALPWGWILAAAAGIGVLVYALVNAKDATESWLSGLESSMLSAKNVLLGTSDLMGDQVLVASQLAFAQNNLAKAAGSFADQEAKVVGAGGAWSANMQDAAFKAGAAATAVHELTGGQLILSDQSQLLADRVATLGGEFTSTTAANKELTATGTPLAAVLRANSGAMGMLIAAGVPMSLMLNKSAEAWAQVQSMVNATTDAYRAMGQTGGLLGADMKTLNYLASDQYTAMSRLNQAYSTLAGVVTASQTSFDTWDETMRSVHTDADKAGASFNGLNKASLTYNQTIEGSLPQMVSMLNAIRLSGAGATTYTRAVKDAATAYGPYLAHNSVLLSQLKTLSGGAIPASVHSFKQLETALGISTDGTDAQRKATENLKGIMNLTTKQTDELNAALTEVGSNAQDLTSSTAGLIENFYHLSGNVKTAVDDLLRYGQSSQITIAAQNAAGVSIIQTGNKLDWTRQQIILYIEKALDVPKSIATEIYLHDQAAVNSLAGFAGLLNGLNGKTVDTYVNTYYQSVGLGSRGGHTDTGKAAGGPVEAAVPYLVGEMGREMFVPDVPGHIYPNSDTERFMSSPSGHGGGAVSSRTTQPSGEAVIHNHVYLDGEELFSNMQRRTLIWDVRNGQAGSGRLG